MKANHLLLTALLVVFGSSAGAESIKPNRDWVDINATEALKKEAPKDGLITDAKAFEKLWKAWRPKEKLPEIDFKNEFVLVTVTSGPNKPFLSADLKDGALTTETKRTLKGGKGFGYSLATFHRKGVKTINGKSLPGG